MSEANMPSIADQTIGGFLQVLGSDSPTPGGGATGAVSGAAGCALISMVASLTIGKKGFDDVEGRMRELKERADTARAELLRLADADAHAFDGVMVAFKMPKETDEQKAARSAAIQVGYEEAALVPLDVARRAVDLMALAEDATAMGNPQAASDGLSAASMLYAGALCAIANVEINAAALKDPQRRAKLLDEVAGLKTHADACLGESQTAFELRLSS
ncbi:MAG: cyclodeaminase/cyclohydrolase family protein [Actinomycetota bacterium]|nr:cyclodeaminase/cyclohydrolase family protein [Actinomycetota bacterium]